MTSRLPTPSVEQKKIVNAIKKNNVKVNAVAGSGKTTTVCLMAKSLPNENFLLLTYNKRLKHETKDRVRKNHIFNVRVENYHSFCFHKYLVHGNTDQMIIDTLIKYQEGNKCTKVEFNYDVIVIDEAQDLTPLYMQLIKLIISHNVKKPRICIIGDTRQTIYTFNGADCRFLEHADKIFNVNDLNWSSLSLSTSYRLSIQMANFLNKCILHNDEIQGYSEGMRPRYLFCNAFGNGPVDELLNFYVAKGYEYKEIFILAPSIQSDLSPVKTFANILSAQHNIPIFIPTSDEEKLDQENIQNKLVFATFHQVKGLERRCVILFGFDNSYYYYYNNDADKTRCPNEIYVGLTRCTERLTVIHHYRKNFINFINDTLISDYCYTEKIKTVSLELHHFKKNNIDFNTRIFDNTTLGRPIDVIMHNSDYNDSLNKKVKLSVTKLLSHLPIEVINNALSYVNIVKIKNADTNKQKIKSPLDSDDTSTENYIEEVVENDGFIVSFLVEDMIKENVSEIVGTGIPIYYEYKRFKELPIKRYIEKELSHKPYNTNVIYNGIKKRYDRIKHLQKIKSSDIFELVTIHLALSNNLIYKLNQIKDFKFMSKPHLDSCYKRLDNHLNTKTRPDFECYREVDVSYDISGYDVPVERTINGYIDCIDDDTVWEFKTVQKIQPSHFLQLSIYAYLYHMNMETGKEFKILNINNGEKYKVEGSIDDFKRLFDYLFVYKFTKPIKVSDIEFIHCQKIEK